LYHRAGYLGDIDNREHGISLDDEKDSTVVLNAVEEELQPPNLTGEEVMEMAIGNSEIDELAQWFSRAGPRDANDSCHTYASSRTDTATSVAVALVVAFGASSLHQSCR
jgi:hypothetical protein